jgi:hypothetical protein
MHQNICHFRREIKRRPARSDGRGQREQTLALSLLGRTEVVTTNAVIPIELDIDVPCAGEVIHATGGVHVVIHTTVDNGGGFLMTFHGNPRGGTAVGMTSGTEYIAVGETHFEQHVRVGENYCFWNTAPMVSKGSAPNLILRDLLHYMINESGEATLYVERHSIECQ